MKDKTVTEFIEALSSNEPTPGGGGAAALSSSISAALCTMVYNLTIGKKFYESYDEKIKEGLKNDLEELKILQKTFLEYIDKDAEGFSYLMSTFKLPKGTEQEKKIREEKIQQGYLKALGVPLDLCKKSLSLYEYIEDSIRYGNPNLISDSAVSIITLYGAVESSIINVKINLKGLSDETLICDIEKQLKRIGEENKKNKEKLLNLALDKLDIQI